MQQLDQTSSTSKVDSQNLSLPYPDYHDGGSDEHQTCSHVSSIAGVINRMRQAEAFEDLLQTTVAEIRQVLQVDRALIYRFDQATQGCVLAESLIEGYTPSLGESLAAITFGAKQTTDYQQPVILDESEQVLSPYQRRLLDQFQIKSSVSLPIFVREHLWGLLAVQQCSQTRQWLEVEILLLYQVVSQLQLSLQRLGFQNERQTLARLQANIRQTIDRETMFQMVTREVRKFLEVEHVAICQFRSDFFGDFVSESKTGDWLPMIGYSWEDTYVRDTQGGRFRHRQSYVIEDREADQSLSPCHIEILKRFEIKAGAIVPIFQGQTLWGLLCAYQHSNRRLWTADDIQFLTQVGDQLGEGLQKVALSEANIATAKHQQELPPIIEKLSNAIYQEQACQTAVQDARQLLNVERVAIYKFRPDYFGDFIYESESGGFPPLVGSAWEDTYLKEHRGGRFRVNEPYVVDDIYTANLSDCHIAALEYFGVKSFLIVAIKQGEQLWGLVSAFQHSAPRHWLGSEIAALTEIGRQLGKALQGADYLAQLQAQSAQMAKVAQINQLTAQLIPKILQAQNRDSVFRITSQSTRILLKCDRVAIYHFSPNGESVLVEESIAKGGDTWQNNELGAFWLRQSVSQDPYNRRLLDRQSIANNIHTVGHAAEEVELLEAFEIKAYIITPIFKGDQLWGMIGAYQSSEARSWAESEVNALFQIAAQVSAAMQQLDYLEQVQQKATELTQVAERERLINKIVERIRRSLDLQKTFQTTAREIRSFLQVDRVAVFQFKAGSNYNDGETIAEDVQAGYSSALGVKVNDHCFGERHAEMYRRGRTWAVVDIYQADLAECYIEILAQFQVRGNLVVPLLKGDELWGLFCIHQCSGPREWQPTELEFARQIAAQLNVAIQQGEYINQLQRQSQRLVEAALQDKAVKEQLQQEVTQLLLSVQPALRGDLTVRAPISATEVGTIADAYNNTLGSLRQIVMQMQTAAGQVTQTSEVSGSALTHLVTQAQQQSQILSQILAQVQTVTHSTEVVETNAQQVKTAVQQTNQIVEAGDTAIDTTVEQMRHIRETVAETNKRLKRLSESSQKISKVVNLISNFATQTQLLALNASIEATRAGEHGRGFAVVAEEVRSLARQSTQAATEIEELVQEIQGNTAEVATAMETGIQQVTSGTTVVMEARQNLSAIVDATAQISQLVTNITQATQGQIQEFHVMKRAMTEVAVIANQTSQDSITVDTSFKALMTTAQDLQARANQFKVE